MIVGYLECTFVEVRPAIFLKKVFRWRLGRSPPPPSTKQSVQLLNSIFSEMQISSAPSFFGLFREPGILVGDAELNIFMLK